MTGQEIHVFTRFFRIGKSIGQVWISVREKRKRRANDALYLSVAAFCVSILLVGFSSKG
jgi:hypothetical protein